MPLQAKFGGLEIVAVRRDDRLSRADSGGRRLAVPEHRLALHGTGGGGPDDRPAALPDDRLQVHHAAVGRQILEVEEPPLAGGRVDQCALMRAVDGRPALVEDDAILIGTGDLPGPEDRLPSGGHATGRSKDIIPAVALVKFRALQRFITLELVAIDHHTVVLLDPGAVRTEPQQGEHVVETCAALRPGMDQVQPAIVVPQRAGIDQAPAAAHEHRGRPRTARIRRRDDIESEIRVRIIDPEPSRVLADRRRPNPLARLRLRKGRFRHQPRQGVTREAPVHQVDGVKNGETGDMAEARRRHPVIVTRPDGIRVGVIGVQDGIAVRAVAEVGDPRRSRHG